MAARMTGHSDYRQLRTQSIEHHAVAVADRMCHAIERNGAGLRKWWMRRAIVVVENRPIDRHWPARAQCRYAPAVVVVQMREHDRAQAQSHLGQCGFHRSRIARIYHDGTAAVVDHPDVVVRERRYGVNAYLLQ